MRWSDLRLRVNRAFLGVAVQSVAPSAEETGIPGTLQYAPEGKRRV